MMVFRQGITYQTPNFADYFCHTLLRLDQLSEVELNHLFNRFRSRVKEGEVEEILKIYERQVEARQARESDNINIRFRETDEMPLSLKNKAVPLHGRQKPWLCWALRQTPKWLPNWV